MGGWVEYHARISAGDGAIAFKGLIKSRAYLVLCGVSVLRNFVLIDVRLIKCKSFYVFPIVGLVVKFAE